MKNGQLQQTPTDGKTSHHPLGQVTYKCPLYTDFDNEICMPFYIIIKSTFPKYPLTI